MGLASTPGTATGTATGTGADAVVFAVELSTCSEDSVVAFAAAVAVLLVSGSVEVGSTLAAALFSAFFETAIVRPFMLFISS